MSTGKPEARDLESPKMSMDEHTSVEVPADVNRRVRRLFDFRVLPIVCCLYVLSYLDRGNIGNAKTAGAQDALGLSSSQWAWVLNSFYIAYILFEWTTMFWKIFPAHIYVAALCLGWGAAAMSSGAARNMAELVITRVFLGIFEATFGAGAPYFLSCIYKREELGLRMAILLGMSPLANTFASTLAYGITHIRNSLEPWRLLFIIEGAPTIAFSVIVYFFLIDSPSTAKFLTEEEKTFAVERLPVRDNTSNQAVSWKQIVSGIFDYKNYMHAAIHFCCNFSFAALSNFLPTIIHSIGYDSVTAQGLSAPVYFAAFILCLASAFFSDRYGNRGYIVASFGAMGAVGYGILAGVRDSTGVRYAGVWLAACGIFPALAMNITWLLNNQGGDSKKGAGLAISLTIGQCSSLISSTVFPKSAGPFYVVGCAIGCGMSGLIVILALVMHFLLSRENRKRDELYGPVDKNQAVDVSQQGDYARNFRYFT
ncbi:high-affinity nicotinic acid transporter [Fusarium mundagurra]|uniref:High-affinity nicotinic acid transporter n=1 Tax=Fusarium mundagurra TaxID=1567541 RepID=A0A8H5XW64_9HYPO|nr:high-affinity nicotinic acid transporter [Fusarium mundagurra]